MYGTNKQPIAIQCHVCKKWVAVLLDKDDLASHRHEGVFVQNAFPYLDAGERELVLTGTCPDCWDRLCPADRLAYN